MTLGRTGHRNRFRPIRTVLPTVFVAALAGAASAPAASHRVANGTYSGSAVRLVVHPRGAPHAIRLVQRKADDRVLRGRCRGSYTGPENIPLFPEVGLGDFRGAAPVVGRVTTYHAHHPFTVENEMDNYTARMDVHFLTAHRARIAVRVVQVATADRSLGDAAFSGRCEFSARFAVRR